MIASNTSEDKGASATNAMRAIGNVGTSISRGDAIESTLGDRRTTVAPDVRLPRSALVTTCRVVPRYDEIVMRVPPTSRTRKRPRPDALFPVNDIPLEFGQKSPHVWGVPLDRSWWCAPERAAAVDDAIPRLGARSRADRAANRPLFAFEVASAYAEVRSWERAGVPIRGRRWVDLGGGDGAHVIALKACGAAEATLIDLHRPAIAAMPVLEAAGARVIVGDIRRVEPVDVDAACFLHVVLPVDCAFRAAPNVDLVVIDQFFAKRDANTRPDGWRARSISAFDLDGVLERCAMGERFAVAAARARESRVVWDSRRRTVE